MKKGQSKQMLIGLIAVFGLFHWLAFELASMRGEAGVAVGLAVVGALLMIQRSLFTASFTDAAGSIGLGRPRAIGIAAAAAIATLMLLSVLVFVWKTGTVMGPYANWQWLAIGLFFQAGIAEEALFRGYLFGHLRQRYTFGKAAALAAVPFVLVHLILFYSLPWPLAAASILLSILTSFPFSKLFELGGGTIWPPAIVHFATQAVAKLILIEGPQASMFPFVVMAISAAAPMLVFLIPYDAGARPDLTKPVPVVPCEPASSFEG